MSLRMRILLFLFVFGLVPLVLAVVINLPLVLERVDLFYRHAFLQNLRADFSDLDQHLASRDASVRLLAKLPEPGALVGGDGNEDDTEIDLARARYTQWIDRILGDERDITEILFLDEVGVERFWLERDGSGKWQPTTRRLRGVPPDQVALLLSGSAEQCGPEPAAHRSDRRRPGQGVHSAVAQPDCVGGAGRPADRPGCHHAGYRGPGAA